MPTPAKKKSNPSLSSTVMRARISNEAHEYYAREWKRQGYDSMGSFVRAVLEAAAQQTAVTVDLTQEARLALQLRGTKKGTPNLALYLKRLLERYAEEPGITEAHEPNR